MHVPHEDDPNDDVHHDAANASERKNSNEPSKFSAKIIESKKPRFSNKISNEAKLKRTK